MFYDKESINNIILENKNFSTKYILALLNSKLINWYYSTKFTNASTLTVNISKAYLSQLPIKDISISKQQLIINLVDKMLSLNKELQEVGNKDKYRREKIEEEIKKTDNQIDEEIYKLYELTPEEIKIVEGEGK